MSPLKRGNLRRIEPGRGSGKMGEGRVHYFVDTVGRLSYNASSTTVGEDGCAFLAVCCPWRSKLEDEV